MSHTEISLVHTTIIIENHNNGSITDHSIKRLKSLTSSQVHSVVVIYDDYDLPSFFKLVRVCLLKLVYLRRLNLRPAKDIVPRNRLSFEHS